MPLQGHGTSQKTTPTEAGRKDNRFWTDDEHQRFLEGLQLYTENNKPDLKAIASHIGSRNVPQVRSHLQKYLLKYQQPPQPPQPPPSFHQTPQPPSQLPSHPNPPF